MRTGLELCRDHGLVPSYAVYEPGFLRLGAAVHAAVAGAPRPIYRFMFSSMFTFGMPPAEWALDTYLRLLADADPEAHWMVAGLGVQVDELRGTAMARGGHVRVGLEDAPLGCSASNEELVGAAARAIEQAGREPATPDQIRSRTGPTPTGD